MNQQCASCQKPFQVTKSDLEFYKDFEVPPPTHCYICRMQRRLGFRNERFLYHRKCDLTGKQMISSFSIDKPFPVYDNDEWWGDEWDAKDYGQNFDFSRPFFDQFFELRNKVPRQARQQQKPMENSDYCNCASTNKNCYLVFSTNTCEDCYYGSWVNNSNDCIDNLNIIKSELCYECVGARECYSVRYSRDVTNCRYSAFLRNCQGCQYCFGCSNQFNKTYMIFNEQKTKDAYEQFMKNVDTGSYNQMHQAKEKIDSIIHDLIVKEFTGVNTENCIGDYLRNCKNAEYCFECDDCEDVRYCQCIKTTKNSMDYSYWGNNAERMYECQACGFEVFNLRFCNLCWNSNDLVYCDHCYASSNSFGCVSLKQDAYCILNKQYSKEEYVEIVPKIIEHMKSTGEYGEFFPLSHSIYAYNETLAQEQVVRTKDQVSTNGWIWKDDAGAQEEGYMGPPIDLPDSIERVDDSICDQILTCAVTGKHFKIIPQELKFYRENRIPLPRTCPDQRHYERLELRNRRVMYKRNCAKCSKDIQTTYAPERPETVYCEECYLNSIA